VVSDPPTLPGFGLFCLAPYRDPARAQAAVLAAVCADVVLAEEIGFETAWIAEHPFSNYCLGARPRRHGGRPGPALDGGLRCRGHAADRARPRAAGPRLKVHRGQRGAVVIPARLTLTDRGAS